MTTFRIWTNARLAPPALDELRAALAAHRLISSSTDRPISPADCDIAFGQPSIEDLAAASALRWVQLTSAGYTRYDTDAVRSDLRRRDVVLTTASDVYADPCAQHVLAFMLAHARQLPAAMHSQAGAIWDASVHRRVVRTLGDRQVVLIVGYGNIGARLAELLRPFDCELIGVRNAPRGDESIDVRAIGELDALLPRADHVVNLLPLSDSTRHLFDARRLTSLKPTAVFYNVGRGDTVDQTALRIALETDRLAAAYLDVTSPEPLPAGDPLWRAPHCFITPHVAGGVEDESHRLVRHFLINLGRFERGEPLRNRVV